MTRRAIWLPLGLFAAAIVGLIGLSAPGAQAGTDATVAIGSGTVASGANIIVDLTVTPSGATIVGALDVDIDYDPAVLTIVNASNPTCNETFDANTIRCSLADLTGLSGVESTIEFTAIGANGTSSALDVIIATCADDTGAPLTCTATDGTINVQAPTPSPVPTAVPTAAPTAVPTATPVGQTPTPVTGAGTATPTPAGLPPTGGDSSSSALPLLLAAMGVATLTAGAWAITRLRRVQA